MILAWLFFSGMIGQAQHTDSLQVKQEIDSLLRKSNSSLTDQRYEEARISAETAKMRAVGYFGENSLAFADCLNTLGAISYKQGKFAESVSRWAQSIRIVEKIEGRHTVLYASRLTNLGAAYKALAVFDSAAYAYKEAIDIFERDTATMKTGYASTLNNLGNLYLEMDRLEEAEPLFAQCLQIRERLIGKENEQYADALSNSGNLRKLQGRYQEAEAYYRDALQIVEKRFGKLHREYARILNNLGNLYRITNDFDSAEALLVEAFQIRSTILGKAHPDYARNLASLANLYKEIGRYEQALPMYDEALLVQEKVFGVQHPNYAVTLHNKAVLLRIMGKYFEAERQYLRVLEIQEKSIGKKTDAYANSLRNLGFLYHLLGRDEEGIRSLCEARDIFGQLHGLSHQEFAVTQADIAAVYTQTEQYALAEQLYKKALPVLEEKLGDQNKAYFLRLQNQAMLFSRLLKHDTALTILHQIKNRFPENNKTTQEYGHLLYNIAFINLRMGRLPEAERSFRESAKIYAAFSATQDPGLVNAKHMLGLLLGFSGRQDTATSLLISAHQEDINYLTLSLGYLSESELSSYLSTFALHSDLFFSVNQIFGDSNAPLREKSFDKALFFKNFSLDAVNRRICLSQSDSTLQISRDIAVYRRRMLQELSKLPAERSAARILEWEEKADNLEKELVRTVAGYGELTRQVSWKDVQQHLRADEAALELVSYRYHNPWKTDSILYAALVLLPADTAPHVIPLFEERQLQALLNRPELGEELTVKSLYASNSELLKLLWTPLEPLLRNVKTVYYSPAGLLHRVNPAALRDADKRYLSESRAWVRVGSTRELIAGRLADRSYALDPANSATAAVWGGIRYDMDSTAFAAANPLNPTATPLPEFERKDDKFRFLVEDGAPALSARLHGADDAGWKPLDGSAREAEQIGQLLQKAGFQTEVLSEYSASEERFKSLGQEAPSPRILHVATHGFAYPDPKKTPQQRLSGEEPVYKIQNDPMLRAGLLLAGANYYWAAKRPLQNREDGVLVAYEVRDLNLRNTELSVLSACQTGLGDVVGSEGVYGLQRAFRIAGAKFLIVSLWQVPDEQTRALMRLFYENWTDKGESLRDAFNHAQVTLREQEPNPYMWAGFLLIE